MMFSTSATPPATHENAKPASRSSCHAGTYQALNLSDRLVEHRARNPRKKVGASSLQFSAEEMRSARAILFPVQLMKGDQLMKRTTLMLATLALSLAGRAQAGPITWGTATNISGDSDVNTTGTLFGAFSLGGPNTTVNGVTFTGIGSHGTWGNFTFNGTGTLLGVGFISTNPPFSTLSAAYQELLGNYGGPVAGSLSLTINGLTVGDQYEFEWWANLSTTYQGGPSLTNQITATAGNSVQLSSNTTGTDGGVGQFVLGNFTATTTSEAITFSGSPTTFINALQVRDLGPATATPEPASLTLLGLGSLSLLGYGWRRRRQSG
jgi:hypothetical protein